MKFSVVIPTYNRAWILPHTIQAVLQQTVQDFEVIIVDDGSTDDTRQIVEGIDDERVGYIYQENARATAARQNGWDHAKGEVIVYVDSDDQVYPEFLEKIDEAVVGAVFGICNHRRRKRLYVGGEVSTETEWESAHSGPVSIQDVANWKVHTSSTGLFHRRNVKAVAWDTDILRFQDWDLLLQLGREYPNGFSAVSEPVFDYVEHYGKDSMCSQASYADWADGFEAMYQKHKDELLLVSQDWYPAKVEKYRQRQTLFEAGDFPSPLERHFKQ